jgi:hypothetical protein
VRYVGHAAIKRDIDNLAAAVRGAGATEAFMTRCRRRRCRSCRMAGVAGYQAAGRQGAVLEHPELVADRIVRFARLVGRDNVIASTDCGLGGRVHPQVAWAKLGALSEGARLASRELWG